MTDLVQRLRRGYTGFATPVNDMCNTAADRIEQLEAVLAQASKARENVSAMRRELERENAELRKALESWNAFIQQTACVINKEQA